MSFKRMPLLITLLALIFFRFYDLNLRPIHHDESVNGWFVDGMFKNGFYNYDPNNYHGPLYFYFLKCRLRYLLQSFFTIGFGQEKRVSVLET
jgi:predicted membrane-bound mannosyltransferase